MSLSQSKRVLVIAPHPDDESIGCGGTLLKHIKAGDSVYWLTVTAMSESLGFSKERIAQRALELQTVHRLYGFTQSWHLDFPTTRLDTIPVSNIVSRVAFHVKESGAEIIYTPFPGDAHTDHKIVYDAAASCLKWFRYPSVRRALAYETLSETDQGSTLLSSGFQANVFHDITPFLDRKIEILKTYASEMENFPFPRSETAIRALAQVRGAASGFQAAEAFMLIKELL